jgi:hypothetical protein
MTALEMSNWVTLLVAIFAGVILFALFCSGGWR